MTHEAVPHDPQAAVEYMLKTAPRFAKAKAQRLFLEEYRKTKKALLMRESTGKAVADREATGVPAPLSPCCAYENRRAHGPAARRIQPRRGYVPLHRPGH